MPGRGVVQRLDHHDEEMFVQELSLDLLAETAKIYRA
jgi:hypothetical protein